MSGDIPPLLKYDFMAWCLVKAEGHLPERNRNKIGLIVTLIFL
jgi:hypothetical protein